MNLRNLDPKLTHLHHQLRAIQLAIAPPSLEDLALLLDGKILPHEPRTHDIPEPRENLIMRDGAGVAEVKDAGDVVAGHGEGAGQQVVQDGHAVGHVDDAGVGHYFGDEVARVQVVRDGHAEAQGQHVWVRFHELFDLGFCGRVVGARKVWRVELGEGFAADLVLVVVVVDAC